MSEVLEVFGNCRKAIIVTFETGEVTQLVETDVFEVDNVVAADVESSEVFAFSNRLR